MNYRSKYLDAFIKLDQFSDLKHLFPNAKEVTESFAAYDAIRQHSLPTLDKKLNEKMIVACIGDGSTPRTAATIALRSNWVVYSIDPALSNKKWDIKRVVCVRKKIEDIENIRVDLIIAVHSHAKLSDCVKKLPGAKMIISMPCCVSDDIDWPLINSYQDIECWSEQNIINIYKPPIVALKEYDVIKITGTIISESNYFVKELNAIVATDYNRDLIKVWSVDPNDPQLPKGHDHKLWFERRDSTIEIIKQA